MSMPTIPLLSRVQPLPAAYGTNAVTNNTAELLARILACDLLSPDTPAIIIYDSAVVHSQHIALLDRSHTHRHRTRAVIPAISRMLAQRLAASQPPTPATHPNPGIPRAATWYGPLTCTQHVLQQLTTLPPCGNLWRPSKHITTTGHHTYIKIKSHQLLSAGFPRSHHRPQPCLAMAHSNHWADKTCELPYSPNTAPSFPLQCLHQRITSPLYYSPMNLYYGIYPVDTDVSDFIASAYQAELLLRLAVRPEMGWYARHMSELQSPNRTFGFTGPTRRLLTHQATSWTQQLYKDASTRYAA